jgi:hypothetical protein
MGVTPVFIFINPSKKDIEVDDNPMKSHQKSWKDPHDFPHEFTSALTFVAKYLSEFCGLAVIHRLCRAPRD